MKRHELSFIDFTRQTIAKLLLIVRILSAKKFVPERKIQPVMHGVLEMMNRMMGWPNKPSTQPMVRKP